MGDKRITTGGFVIRLAAWTIGGATAGVLGWAIISPQAQGLFSGQSSMATTGVEIGAFLGAIVGILVGGIAFLFKRQETAEEVRSGAEGRVRHSFASEGPQESEYYYESLSYRNKDRTKIVRRIPRQKSSNLRARISAIVVAVLVLGALVGVLFGWSELATYFGEFNMLVYAAFVLAIILAIVGATLSRSD